MKRAIKLFLLSGPVALLVVSGWLVFATGSMQPLPQNLAVAAPATWASTPYAQKANALVSAFQPQRVLSFCGPSSVATVLRAYGNKEADQWHVFPSAFVKIKTFYTGVDLAGLSDIATHAGLHNELVYADVLTLEQFRERLKTSLARENEYVLINFDRKVLAEEGAGHISPIAAYDAAKDAFLLLDEAGYKYPFTWVPAEQLYNAARTRDGSHYRGLLFIDRYTPRA